MVNVKVVSIIMISDSFDYGTEVVTKGSCSKAETVYQTIDIQFFKSLLEGGGGALVKAKLNNFGFFLLYFLTYVKWFP